ncbi:MULTISPECIES: hypothetical protein [unclassified Micromonospora]|uniref:hypothetical protein n=1 Tax=unclassified Micromonospora TaxID=2617518 RepID=UPI0036349E46
MDDVIQGMPNSSIPSPASADQSWFCGPPTDHQRADVVGGGDDRPVVRVRSVAAAIRDGNTVRDTGDDSAATTSVFGTAEASASVPRPVPAPTSSRVASPTALCGASVTGRARGLPGRLAEQV